MFIIRTVFYLIIAYFISKLIRVFFESNGKPENARPSVKNSNSEPIQKKKEKATLGDYVDYEEVKS